jgi:hypothetical protein
MYYSPSNLGVLIIDKKIVTIYKFSSSVASKVEDF